MQQVESSHIKAVEYDGPSSTLTIEFHKGKRKTWTYHPISLDGYKALMSADSIGAYFNLHIKTNTDIEATPI